MVRSAEAAPRIAVITPYHREDIATLERCHRSVLAQTHPCRHVLVADGHPQEPLQHWQADHLQLPLSHDDIGSTPRLIGAIHAIGLGVDAVAFLDADNWYRPTHIETLVRLHEGGGAVFLASQRSLYSLDGSELGPCPITDPERFIDTNSMMFWREAFPLLHHWVLMPSYAHLIGDRVMLHHVRQSGLPTGFSPEPTVCYTCGKPGLYQMMGVVPPAGVQPRPNYEQAMQQWQQDGHPPLP